MQLVKNDSYQLDMDKWMYKGVIADLKEHKAHMSMIISAFWKGNQDTKLTSSF